MAEAPRVEAPESPGETWDLRLYVVDESPKCRRALENLRRACEKYVPDRYQIEIVDLLEDPQQAATDQILVVPTLVRRFQAAPSRKIIGDLTDPVRLLAGLKVAVHLTTGQ